MAKRYHNSNKKYEKHEKAETRILKTLLKGQKEGEKSPSTAHKRKETKLIEEFKQHAKGAAMAMKKQNRKDRRDEREGMERYEERRERKSSMAFGEDRSAPANMPQEVIQREYPNRFYVKEYGYGPNFGDTIEGVDDQMDDDGAQTQRHRSKSKY